MHIKKLFNKVFKASSEEIEIEINKEELDVLRKGVESSANSLIADIAAETKPDAVAVLIEIYNNSNKILDAIKEEEENEFEELTLNKPQIDIVISGLNRIEVATTNNLKMIEDPSNYKTLCKTMVIISNLTERIYSKL